MMVQELIEKLKEMPQTAHVYWPMRGSGWSRVRDEADPVEEVELYAVRADAQFEEYEKEKPILVRAHLFRERLVESLPHLSFTTVVVIH